MYQSRFKMIVEYEREDISSGQLYIFTNDQYFSISVKLRLDLNEIKATREDIEEVSNLINQNQIDEYYDKDLTASDPEMKVPGLEKSERAEHVSSRQFRQTQEEQKEEIAAQEIEAQVEQKENVALNENEIYIKELKDDFMEKEEDYF